MPLHESGGELNVQHEILSTENREQKPDEKSDTLGVEKRAKEAEALETIARAREAARKSAEEPMDVSISRENRTTELQSRLDSLSGAIEQFTEAQKEGRELTTEEYFGGCRARCEKELVQVIVLDTELAAATRKPNENTEAHYRDISHLVSLKIIALKNALKAESLYIRALKTARDHYALEHRLEIASEYAEELKARAAKLERLLDMRSHFYAIRPSILESARPPRNRFQKMLQWVWSTPTDVAPPLASDIAEASVIARQFAAPQKEILAESGLEEVPTLPPLPEETVQSFDEKQKSESLPVGFPATLGNAGGEVQGEVEGKAEAEAVPVLEPLSEEDTAEEGEAKDEEQLSGEKKGEQPRSLRAVGIARIFKELTSEAPAYGSTGVERLDLLDMLQKVVDEAEPGEIDEIELNGKKIKLKDLQLEIDYYAAAELNTILDSEIEAFAIDGIKKGTKEEAEALVKRLSPYMRRSYLGSKRRKEYGRLMKSIFALKMKDPLTKPEITKVLKIIEKSIRA